MGAVFRPESTELGLVPICNYCGVVFAASVVPWYNPFQDFSFTPAGREPDIRGFFWSNGQRCGCE
jgi:hypothetical protein